MKDGNIQWERFDREEGPDLKLFRVRFDYLCNPRNQEVIKAVVLNAADSVNVIAVTTEGTILMVRQYRFGVEKETLELPGGLVEEGEDSQAAAQRELEEETGYTGGEWTFLGSIQSNPVYQSSYLHHWLVIGVEFGDLKNEDAGEYIHLEQWSKEDLVAALRAGTIQHPHTISALSRIFSWNDFSL